MGGTIADSENLKYQVYNKIMEEFNLEFPPDYYKRFVGAHNQLAHG